MITNRKLVYQMSTFRTFSLKKYFLHKEKYSYALQEKMYSLNRKKSKKYENNDKF